MGTLRPHYNTTLDPASLAGYFVSGCKSPEDLQVGVEWEKIGIDRETGRAIPYSGPRSVRAIFEALIGRYGWQPVLSGGGDPIGLDKGPVHITLEPGGQIELSGQKAGLLYDNAAELYLHLVEIRDVSGPLGIVWLGLGAQPFSTHEEIEWTPKERYGVMRENLKGHGALTFAMMKETASVQASFDYTSEADAAEKFRLSMALSPLLVALFANSPFERGERSRYLCRRAHIWTQTDPARTGIVWEAFKPDFSFQDYVDFALKVPMLFIQRGGSWIAMPRIPFSEFLKNGWGGHEATAADWELHLSSIFTETRLKKYMEVRSIDCQATPLGLAAVAFLKGLFYDARSLRAAWDLLKDLTPDERKKLSFEAPRTALATAFKNKTLLYLAEQLFELAQSGISGRERKLLAPVATLLAEKRCPAERLLDCAETARDRRTRLDHIIGCTEV